MKRREIASLARVVDKEAEAGDAVARRCLEQAAEEFAELARDVVEQLGMAECAFPVVPMGSVARGSRIWWEWVETRLLTVAPKARIVTPRLSPAGGAALVALEKMGVEWTEEVVGRVASGERRGHKVVNGVRSPAPSRDSSP